MCEDDPGAGLGILPGDIQKKFFQNLLIEGEPSSACAYALTDSKLIKYFNEDDLLFKQVCATRWAFCTR